MATTAWSGLLLPKTIGHFDALCAALREEGWLDYYWDIGHGDGNTSRDSSLSVYRSWLTVSR